MKKVHFVNDVENKYAQISAFTPTNEQIQEIDDFCLKYPEAALRMLHYEDKHNMKFVKKFKNVKHLMVESCQRGDFSFISDFEGLKSLEFFDNSGKYTIEFMKTLTELDDLQFDTVRSGKTQDLQYINGLKSLEMLNFKGRFKKKSLVLDFPKLEDFAPKLEYVNLEEVGALHQLKSLYLLSQKVDSLDFITKIPSLQTVELDSLRIENQSILSPVFDLPNLRNLGIAYVRGVEDFTFVKPCPSLKMLIVNALNDLVSLRGIEKLENIEKYTQWGEHEHRNEIDFQPLTQLKHLKEVSVTIGTMSQEAEKRLTETLGQVKLTP